MNPLRIIFAGSGEFGLPTLRALLHAGHQIVTVITQLDRPAGRGRVLTPTPIGKEAELLGLPLIRTGDINTLVREERLPRADVMIVIAFGQKIADEVIHHPRLGSVNLHSSRLPRYRGAAPINWAIIAGDTITGNSVIRLAQKMDAGAILAQSELVIGELETAGELHDRLAQDGAPLVLKVLQSLSDGTAVEVEQDHSQATIAKKLSREAARIDWYLYASVIARQILGMYPWPGCRVEVIEADKVVDTLTLVRARKGSSSSAGISPGTIAASPELGVGTGGGELIAIVEVQPAGKRPMPLEAYRRGHRWNPGMQLRSI